MLAEKATAAQSALEEAKSALQGLKEGDGSKQDEYEALKKEGVRVKKQLAEAEAKVQVGAGFPFEPLMSHDGDLSLTIRR